ncbi:long-chain fatty acid--CoA ligase [uncultured Methylovirgula sp.]|uniref:long-chain-fatty-acid--CoA ligase n=1 Tax=uncultured Methylovirgula sp. TaxID=1285960 RepID=UPI002603DCC1|nr:long-chain fatty acid--CoA ligase [uncultured Methylovirgula sp.]
MSSDPEIAITTSSVPALLDEAAARFPHHVAIDFFGRKLTYAELARRVDRVARGFQNIGVERGTRVGLCLPNSPYFIIAYYAVLKAGGVIVNFNPLYVAREIAQQIENSGTTIMVTLDVAKIYPTIAEVLETSSLKKVVVCSLRAALPPLKGLLFGFFKAKELARIPRDERHIPFARLLADHTPPARVAINPAIDLAVLQYTGGTTGVPKGAMLSHANLTANVAQIRDRVPVLRPGQERALVLLPLFHVFGMTTCMNFCISLGAELVLLPSFDLAQVLEFIIKKKPTLFPGVPSLFATVSHKAEHEKFDLSSIRYCISGGASLPLETRQRFEALTGCKLVEGYGLTEAAPVVAANALDAPYKNESVGPPLKGLTVEIRSLDDPTKILRTGERGEICLRGPNIMAGYWRNLEETKAVFIDGALRTGDVGYLDKDGDLFLVDRIKDIIICNGFKIYPRMIEEALLQHPAVAEAVAIGVADPVRGQVPKAFVTLLPGTAATPADLLDFLRTHLSRLELPRAIEIRATLPKTNIGKISRKDLVVEETRNSASASA